MDNSTLIFVDHLKFGKIHRLFLSDAKMEVVYNWVGSLASTSELFELCSSVPGSLQIIDTSEIVSKYERRYLTMR